MSDETNYADLSEIEVMRKISLNVQRHIANVENALAMMRNGHFIDAYNRIGGSKEGLIHLRFLTEQRIMGLANNKTNETNSD